MAVISDAALAQPGVRGGADSVKVTALQVESETPAERLTIAVRFEHAAGFHSWPNEPVVPPELRGLMPIATSVEVTSLPEGVQFDEIDWPEPVPVTVRYIERPLVLLSFTDTAIAYLHLQRIEQGPSGDPQVGLTVRYQACDERVCYPPKRVRLTVPLQLE